MNNFKIKNFYLLEVSSGEKKYFKNYFSKIANVFMFICNHCPYVQHINNKLVNISKEFIAKNISFLGINSNDITRYPEDSPINMKKISEKFKYPFPYFFDSKQIVAKHYKIKYTPEFLIFSGKNGRLYYRGRFDKSTPNNNVTTTGKDIKRILLDIIDNKIIIKKTPIYKESIGCSIKWKK